MRTVAVANQKGGVGKTTTTVNLAAALGELGYSVLVLDLDPQHSASAWLGLEPDPGILDVLEGKKHLADLARETTAKGVECIASTPDMANAERALAGEPGGEAVLREAFVPLPRRRWAFVLVDSPPSLGMLTLNALTACREVLVPVESRPMALAGLAALLETVERVKRRLNPELRITGILPSRVDLRTNLSREALRILREEFPELVTDTVIRETVRLGEAPGFAQPITTYDPHGYGAADYLALAAEFIGRENE